MVVSSLLECQMCNSATEKTVFIDCLSNNSHLKNRDE